LPHLQVQFEFLAALVVAPQVQVSLFIIVSSSVFDQLSNAFDQPYDYIIQKIHQPVNYYNQSIDVFY